jgi:adenosyl cobinamide kinase/adenosyl cobinamide phosphate guanylyltransferase
VADPDLLALMKQIRAEAATLRVVAREADMEMAEYVAASRTKREQDWLRHERHSTRPAERTDDVGEDR